MGAALRILLVAALLFGALAAMITERTRLIAHGREIILAVGQIDPTDLFRGDYVTLNYTGLSAIVFKDADRDSTEGQPLRAGDTVYIALNVGPDGHAAPKSLHRSLDAARADSAAVLRGRITYTGSIPVPASGVTFGEACTARDCTDLRVLYGIESYFIPQGSGARLQQERNAHQVEMLIALDAGGEAAIKGVIVGGKRAYIETPF